MWRPVLITLRAAALICRAFLQLTGSAKPQYGLMALRKALGPHNVRGASLSLSFALAKALTLPSGEALAQLGGLALGGYYAPKLPGGYAPNPASEAVAQGVLTGIGVGLGIEVTSLHACKCTGLDLLMSALARALLHRGGHCCTNSVCLGVV